MLTEIRTGSVPSRDGTTIGYRRQGAGPGLVLLHGAMQSSHSHRDLASVLADAFTVYLPDRRGRGLSGPHPPAGDVLRTEVDDLAALIAETGAERVFGVSSGALVALCAALEVPAIRRLAVFEPPLYPARDSPAAVLERFDREFTSGRLPAAMVTAMLAAEMGPALFRRLPRRLLERLTALAMAQQDRRPVDGMIPMRRLGPTLRHDLGVVTELAGTVERFRPLGIEVLLLGGGRTRPYLKRALDDLARVLPLARRIELPGLDHGATGNSDERGRPAVVGEELRRFFG
ncbi:alpha/beta fold hydrolase [Plantactinospora sp. GCM10030261]|uniref:alpha/beta fold hydrolase n=1 Tax=Plantactinospora sp. GCM10030261 TaxID=3273420 RepID=UPI003619D966